MNLLTEFAQYWTSHLWSTSLQVTILISLVFAISFFFKRFPARYRYTLWLLVLVRLAVPTSITSPLGIGQYPEKFLAGGIQWVSSRQLLPTPQMPIIPETFPETLLETMESTGVSLENPAAFLPTAGSMDEPVPLLWSIWFSVVFVLVIVIITRILLFHRRTRSFKPITRPDLVDLVHRLRGQLGIKRAVRLLGADEADNIQFPSIHGILRPTIIMPAGLAADWTTDDLEPLLLHELTHIKRRDCLVNFAQIVFQVLYFYHPMVWIANWIIRREREFACDDDVVRHSSGSPTAYVRSMLRIAETAVNQRRHHLLGIAMADNFSSLGRRIRRMMNKGYGANQKSGLIYIGIIFLSGIFCAAVSARGWERPAADPQMKSFVQEYPDINGYDASVTSSGVLEPVPEDRIQAEATHDTLQSALDVPVISMLHQTDGMIHPTDLSNDSRPRIRVEIPYDDQKIVLTSDRQAKENRTLLAAGNVRISFSDMVITTDEAIYDEETRRVSTRGETKFSTNNISLNCSRSEFDFDTKTGTFYDASGNFNDSPGREFFFSGRMILKNSDNKLEINAENVRYEQLQSKKQSTEEDPAEDVDLRTGTLKSQRNVIPSAETLYEKGLKMLETHRYKEAGQAFEQLKDTYPGSRFEAPLILAIADSFYNEGGTENRSDALYYYYRFLIRFPTHPKADDVELKTIALNSGIMNSPGNAISLLTTQYLMTVQMYFSGYTGNYEYKDNPRDGINAYNPLKAEEIINRYLRKYPDSDLAPVAKQTLGVIRESLADEYFRMAGSFFNRYDGDRALSLLERIIDKYPDFSRIDEVRQMYESLSTAE